MRILFAASEAYPFSKTGGLADVIGALPQALAAQGHEVLVVSPWYATLSGRPLWIGDVTVPFDGATSPVGVGTIEQDGVRFAFVGHGDFQRDRLYGYADDVYRFCRFARAVPQVAERVGFLPDIVHAHDWQAAYLPMLLTHGWHLPAGFPGLPTVLTIHNVQYQGESGIDETLFWLRLPGALSDSWIDHFGRANALQAGIGFADRITTVSPSYAQEITLPEYGFTLDGTLRHLQHKLVGILNGLDTTVWDPGSDPHLLAPYGPHDLSGKARNKAEFVRLHGLDSGRPLLAVISRLAQQKGIDVLLPAVPELLRQGWSLFFLGTGDEPLERAIAALAEREDAVAARLGYDESLAHLAYAAADALAVPSRFEPCGLSQLIAMRYGTLPIARATGGLRDTIAHERTGFLFEQLDPAAVAWAGGAAAARYGSPRWTAMMRSAMGQDFSWSRSARLYAQLYADVRGAA